MGREYMRCNKCKTELKQEQVSELMQDRLEKHIGDAREHTTEGAVIMISSIIMFLGFIVTIIIIYAKLGIS